MKLVDLNPRWVSSGGEGIKDKNGDALALQRGTGITFDCPCGKCGMRPSAAFSNPIDGSSPVHRRGSQWTRTGDSFDNLTLHPSLHQVKEKGGCGWHGWLKNGILTSC